MKSVIGARFGMYVSSWIVWSSWVSTCQSQCSKTTKYCDSFLILKIPSPVVVFPAWSLFSYHPADPHCLADTLSSTGPRFRVGRKSFAYRGWPRGGYVSLRGLIQDDTGWLWETLQEVNERNQSNDEGSKPQKMELLMLAIEPPNYVWSPALWALPLSAPIHPSLWSNLEWGSFLLFHLNHLGDKQGLSNPFVDKETKVQWDKRLNNIAKPAGNMKRIQPRPQKPHRQCYFSNEEWCVRSFLVCLLPCSDSTESYLVGVGRISTVERATQMLETRSVTLTLNEGHRRHQSPRV